MGLSVSYIAVTRPWRQWMLGWSYLFRGPDMIKKGYNRACSFLTYFKKLTNALAGPRLIVLNSNAIKPTPFRFNP